MSSREDFADSVVRWQRQHGRNSLPWQNTRDPYRVWLSEIMLQQTQVTTVLGYYSRFLERFPDVRALADAPEDAVLALWAGLGYYSRARNLHSAAKQVMEKFGGSFPNSAQALSTLPGVGRSTAAAIAAFCFGERVPILDANVRRVLARFLGFAGDLSRAGNERALWDLAANMVPASAGDMPAYTQGLMDLGSSICTSRRPSCLVCPLQQSCVARLSGEVERYPVRTRRVPRKQASWWLLVLHDPAGRVWLLRRPSPGIWAGLYCTPAFDDESTLRAYAGQCGARDVQSLLPFKHVLTHRDLTLHPVRALSTVENSVDTLGAGAWFSAYDIASLGLPAPLRSLLLP